MNAKNHPGSHLNNTNMLFVHTNCNSDSGTFDIMASFMFFVTVILYIISELKTVFASLAKIWILKPHLGVFCMLTESCYQLFSLCEMIGEVFGHYSLHNQPNLGVGHCKMVRISRKVQPEVLPDEIFPQFQTVCSLLVRLRCSIM